MITEKVLELKNALAKIILDGKLHPRQSRKRMEWRAGNKLNRLLIKRR